MRTIVVGLDGASWNLLAPWLEAGRLPHLQALRAGGVWSDLESCLPPVTSPNWKCYSTGKNPGKLGVFWWEKVSFKERQIRIPRSTDFRGRELWDYLGQSGKTVAVINMPTMYPPRPVNGWLAAGGPDALEDGFTFPSEWQGELKRRYAYRVHPRLLDFIRTDSARAVEDIYRVIESRFQVAIDLLRERQPDFLHLTVFYINVLQHHFWDEDFTLQAWQRIDHCLGELVEAFPGANLVLMSDHGANKIEWKFNINTWLEQEGYLNLKHRPADGLLSNLGLNRDCLSRWAARLRVKDFLKRHLSETTRNILPTDTGAVRSEAKARLIDWERTRVLASGQGPIYINLNPQDPAYETLRGELREKLKALCSDEDGWPVARDVYLGEEVYTGYLEEEVPALVIDQNDGIHITPSLGFPAVFERPNKWKGENRRLGLFVGFGPFFAQGRLEHPLRIVDLAPTLLHLYGLPVPQDMDGRVVLEAFREGSSPRGREVVYESARTAQTPLDERENEETEVRGRLEGLGYL